MVGHAFSVVIKLNYVSEIEDWEEMVVEDRRWRRQRDGERAEITFLKWETKYQFFCLLDLYRKKVKILIFPCHVIGGRKGCTKRVVHDSFSSKNLCCKGYSLLPPSLYLSTFCVFYIF